MLFEEIGKANIQALKDHDKTARAILSVLYGKLLDKYVSNNSKLQRYSSGTLFAKCDDSGSVVSCII